MPTADQFFASPILNGPYEMPDRHWVLTADGQPTDRHVPGRRTVDFVSAVPKPKRKSAQADLSFGESRDGTRYETAETITAIRRQVDEWRVLPEDRWNVTPHTKRLLRHWRRKDWPGRRPFFCQVEAAETVIWLTEVAPRTASGKQFLRKLEDASADANPGLSRWALKLATGAGKTTVMAMLIAWQTVNAVRMPSSSRFARGFLLVAPGITIRDRLRVLQPADPEAYYQRFDLVPDDLLNDVKRAQIVITNFHAFQLRETRSLSKGNRALQQGLGGEEVVTLESPGQMLKRVCSELMGLGGIMVINDEAHHCYRERPAGEAEGETVDDLTGDEKQEAKKDSEYARLWISGLEYAAEKLGVNKVLDLSATPFFLRGSGYTEGTLFPWTVSDFSLMDAIECGIVKLPRIPIADNIPSAVVPEYRELWKHVGKGMPKKGRGKNATAADPSKLPQKLQTALEALYGHYKQTFELWERQQLGVPPCFIVVCNNTASSKLVYDYVSGYETDEGQVIPGKFDLFDNYLPQGSTQRRDKPRTLLVDSRELDSGEAVNKDFLEAYAAELQHFRREKAQREGQSVVLDGLADEDILREVLNTVGKPGKLGQDIRCVVSVSMLTEGWDANTVTHVLGVRAFGTQLLCEQVMGRALRRFSYELGPDGKFPVEYADIFGIPFDFTAEPVKSVPAAPRRMTRVAAVRERERLEIEFPRVEGYRIERPMPDVHAEFTEEDRLTIDPSVVGATEVKNSGVIGEAIDLDLVHTKDTRTSTIVMHLTQHLIEDYLTDADGYPRSVLFGSARKVVRRWLGEYLVCNGGTYPAQLLYRALAKEAASRINNAILRAAATEDNSADYVKPILDSYNPVGSTRHVAFNTSKDTYATDAACSHVDHVVEDSGWEGEMARVLERHPKVLRYVKNQGLGFEIPYVYGGQRHKFVPDFIVVVDDGHGPDDPLHLIAEVKGRRDEQVNAKHNTVKNQWLPAVNGTGAFGRWAFAEFEEPFGMSERLGAVLGESVEEMVAGAFAKTG